MAGELAGFLVLFALVGIGGPILLYVLVRQEHEGRREMSRAEAERVARRDTNGGARDRAPTRNQGADRNGEDDEDRRREFENR